MVARLLGNPLWQWRERFLKSLQVCRVSRQWPVVRNAVGTFR